MLEKDSKLHTTSKVLESANQLAVERKVKLEYAEPAFQDKKANLELEL